MSAPLCTSCSERPTMELVSTSRHMNQEEKKRPYGHVVGQQVKNAGHPYLAAAIAVGFFAAKMADTFSENAHYKCPNCGIGKGLAFQKSSNVRP
jgi:hypothetical protein